MEFQEPCKQDQNHEVHCEANQYAHLFVFHLTLSLLATFFGPRVVASGEPVKILAKGKESHVGQQKSIDKQIQEKLPVPESNTVIDPGTVVVHVQHASITCRAMVATVGLENIADEAVAPPFGLVVTKVEAPKHGYLTRITVHGLEE